MYKGPLLECLELQIILSFLLIISVTLYSTIRSFVLVPSTVANVMTPHYVKWIVALIISPPISSFLNVYPLFFILLILYSQG